MHIAIDNEHTCDGAAEDGAQVGQVGVQVGQGVGAGTCANGMEKP